MSDGKPWWMRTDKYCKSPTTTDSYRSDFYKDGKALVMLKEIEESNCEKSKEIAKLKRRIDEQQKEINELNQENADLLGDKIRSLDEFEKCTNKLKKKILEQQATINNLKERNAHNFAKKLQLLKENEKLKEENQRLIYHLNKEPTPKRYKK